MVLVNFLFVVQLMKFGVKEHRGRQLKRKPLGKLQFLPVVSAFHQ